MTNDCSKSTVFLNYPKRSHFIHKSEVVFLQNSSEFHNLQNLFCKMRSFGKIPHTVCCTQKKKRINGSKSFGFLFLPKELLQKSLCLVQHHHCYTISKIISPYIFFFLFHCPWSVKLRLMKEALLLAPFLSFVTVGPTYMMLYLSCN